MFQQFAIYLHTITQFNSYAHQNPVTYSQAAVIRSSFQLVCRAGQVLLNREDSAPFRHNTGVVTQNQF